MKTVTELIEDIEKLRVSMGKSTSTLTQKDKLFINEQKMNELQAKRDQINADIDKEINEFFGYWNMKQANIDVLNQMLIHVDASILKLERDNRSLIPD